MSSNRPHSTLIARALLAALVALPAAAQELEISVSPTPIGSGARAAGMADAFVAIADDATAASWNPAGLVQLERPEISIVGAFNGVGESFGADFHPEVDSRHSARNTDLNFLSVVYPLPLPVLGRNVTVSMSYQHKYDFSRDFVLGYHAASAISRGTVLNNLLELDFEQAGSLSTLSPAIAFEITHRLSVGATLNLWRSSLFGDNGWSQDVRNRSVAFLGASTILGDSRSREAYGDFEGENLVLGALWNPTDRWSLGLRYDTAFTGEAKYRASGYRMQVNLPGPGSRGFLSVTPSGKRETRHVRFPDSLAFGAAYRANDRLTLSLDVTRTDWNDFYVKDAEGRRYSLVDFSPLNERLQRPRFDPTYTVRFGAEYVFVPREPEERLGALWTMRGGLFYDEEPATDRSRGFAWPGDNGTGKPDAFYGFALGAGLLLGQRVNLDAAYQLRYGPGVNADFIRGVDGFQEDVVQHRFVLSTVVYF